MKDHNRIRLDEISVVIQGNLEKKYFDKCLLSVKKYLPEAEIIISTWPEDEQYVAKNECDKIIISKDPGCFLLNKEGKEKNNINRQLVSTRAGIARASKKYILKLRSNIEITSNEFIKKYEDNCEKAEAFEQKLMVLDYYTRNARIINMCYHPSDWVVFGLADDVKRWFDIDLETEEEAMWYLTHVNTGTFFKNVYSRYTPEQYICINNISKIYTSNRLPKEYCDCDKIILKESERFLAMNLCVVDSKASGFVFLKYNPNRYFERMTLITESDWHIINSHYSGYGGVDWIYYLIKCMVKRVEFVYFRGCCVNLIRRFGLHKWIKGYLK